MVMIEYIQLMMEAHRQYIFLQPLSFMATLNGVHMYVIHCKVSVILHYSTYSIVSLNF